VATRESLIRKDVDLERNIVGHAGTGVTWTSYPRLSSFAISRLVAAPLARRSPRDRRCFFLVRSGKALFSKLFDGGIACGFWVLSGRFYDGKGKAWPSGPRIWLGSFRVLANSQAPPASRLAKTSMVSTIRAPAAPRCGRKGPKRGGSPGSESRGERTGKVRQPMVSYM